MNGEAALAWARSRSHLLGGLVDRHPGAGDGRTWVVMGEVDWLSAAFAVTLAESGRRVTLMDSGTTAMDTRVAAVLAGREMDVRAGPVEASPGAIVLQRVGERAGPPALPSGSAAAVTTGDLAVPSPIPVVDLSTSLTLRSVIERREVPQQVVRALLRATNRRLPGARVLVVGASPAGRAVARLMARMGGRVRMVAAHPVAAMALATDGIGIAEPAAAAGAELVIVGTGSDDAGPELDDLADGAVVVDAGLGGSTLDLSGSTPIATRPSLARIDRPGGPVFWVTATGPPTLELCDVEGAVLFLAGMAAPHLPPGVHAVPAAVDHEVATAMVERGTWATAGTVAT